MNGLFPCDILFHNYFIIIFKAGIWRGVAHDLSESFNALSLTPNTIFLISPFAGAVSNF